jgi:hypothetical protein
MRDLTCVTRSTARSTLALPSRSVSPSMIAANIWTASQEKRRPSSSTAGALTPHMKHVEHQAHDDATHGMGRVAPVEPFAHQPCERFPYRRQITKGD